MHEKPKHIVRQGKTPVLSTEETRHLLDSIPLNTIVGLRDRALIGVMVYNFGRVGAALAMRVEDYHRAASAGCSAFTRRAVRSMPYRPTIGPRSMWMPMYRPPVSGKTRKVPCFGPSTAAGS